MKKVIVGLVAVFALFAVVGCSHNVGTAFNGRVFNVGYDPELNKVGIQYYNGLMVTGVGRENSEVSLEYNDDAAIGNSESKVSGSADAKATFKYEQKVGRQITGYYVDARKAGATAEELDAYTKTPATEQNTEAGGGEEVKDESKSASQESGEPEKAEVKTVNVEVQKDVTVSTTEMSGTSVSTDTTASEEIAPSESDSKQ